MDRSRRVVLAAVMLLGGIIVAQAGPCTERIAQVEQKIRQLQATPSGAGQPSGTQSIGAQLHHQPTPQTVESAESQARAAAEAALNRARKADAAGDASTCARAVEVAEDFYGLR